METPTFTSEALGCESSAAGTSLNSWPATTSDFKMTMHYDAGRPIDGNASFNRIELAPLRQLAAYLPLPTRWRDDLARFAPRGTLDQVQMRWTGDITGPAAFDGSANFAGFGFAQQDAVPGVGALVRIGADAGRAAHPAIMLGVCGEHGGDPDSIDFFEQIGLDYVSCSPFRVPIARVAAAQAAIRAGG